MGRTGFGWLRKVVPEVLFLSNGSIEDLNPIPM
jgi:hypothetical protein